MQVADDINVRIKDRVIRLTDLPTIPITISRLIKILKNENASIDDLSEIIRHDQSIASRIVAVANSPFFGYPGKINSIEQAILMLGLDLVKSISLSVSVISLLPAYHALFRKMWAHSYIVATLSGLIGSRMSITDKGICFLAGLLHDIGRVVLVNLYRNDYPAVFDAKNIISAEREMFQCDHIQAGVWFLESLSFPEEIVMSVSCHHDINGTDKHTGILTPVYLAEGIVSMPNIALKYNGDGSWTERHAKAFMDSGFREHDAIEFKSILLDRCNHINSFFDL